ncbi:hypothetical protein L615_001500000680 [Nocardioides sp. J9]|uniref:Ig-like domain repeat protein n=1 Tax=unclassified Nocardioides TaxID=2615069 RepID=UPI0011AD2008|nr:MULTISPECIES: Ig-like domain repeat protein [unclassified Nocardioides]TWH01895.1 hypothetical protein L615_001500000680 [Nocardioides sp. J9]
MSVRAPFDGNDYRKRVLAAVHRRGGLEASDPFELYDVPVDDVTRWSEEDVATRVGEVWGFWQRQRDHPKYGTLVGLLVATHDENSADLLDPSRRAAAAEQVRRQREARDAARFQPLDEAVSRLVQRHGGIPRDKLEGLVEVGALGGLTRAEVELRLRRHRVVDPAPAAPATPPPAAPLVSDHRRQQVRDLLDELGRLEEQPPPPTLLALLGLDPGADDAEVALRAEAWRARCRELPPLRVRAVADELMVHVAELLERGPVMRDAYLDAVLVDVQVRLRPRVRAAALVEDRLTAEDHEHLYEEALALGLDPARAREAIAGLAAELDVEVEPVSARRPSRPAPPPAPASSDPSTPPAPSRPAERPWEAGLRAARAALRRGALLEARRLVGQVSASGDPAATTPLRAVADEVEQAVREAELQWRAAAAALGARRFAEAVEHLEHLARVAADLPPPAGLQPAAAELARARAEVAEADARTAAARSAPDPVAALVAVLERWPQHPGAVAALAALPLRPPGSVHARRDASGAVVVEWQPSPTAGASYKVSRVEPGGRTSVVGRTAATRIEDGGAPASRDVPDYVVVAVQPGRTSAESRTGRPAPSPTPVAPPAAASTPAPVDMVSDVVAARGADGSVHVRWRGPAGVEFKVSRRAPDGRWQVVGRTRATGIEDGGAPPGEVPVYAVSARGDDGVSPEVYSRPT